MTEHLCEKLDKIPSLVVNGQTKLLAKKSKCYHVHTSTIHISLALLLHFCDF